MAALGITLGILLGLLVPLLLAGRSPAQRPRSDSVVMPRSGFPTVLDRIKAAYVEGRVEIDRLELDIATVLESGLADEESVATYPACMGPSLQRPPRFETEILGDAPLFDTPRLDRVV